MTCAKIFSAGVPPRWMVLSGGNNILFTQDYDGVLLTPVARQITILESAAKRFACASRPGSSGTTWSNGPSNAGSGASKTSRSSPERPEQPPCRTSEHTAARPPIRSAVWRCSASRPPRCSRSMPRTAPSDIGKASSSTPLKGAGHHHRHRTRTLLHAPAPTRVRRRRTRGRGTRRRHAAQHPRGGLRHPPGETPRSGRAGKCRSFFKNPVVEPTVAEALLAEYPDMPHYPAPEGRVKPRPPDGSSTAPA